MLALIDGDLIAHEMGHLGVKDEVTGDRTPIPAHRREKLTIGRLLSIERHSGAGGMTVYLTGKDNFREQIATIKPYKGNRVDMPQHEVPDVKQHLVSLGAQYVQGMEADDAIAIEQWQDILLLLSKYMNFSGEGLVTLLSDRKEYDSTIEFTDMQTPDQYLREHSHTVICSRDKDLDNVPGWHYKWKINKDEDDQTGELYWVTPHEAFGNFYAQLLTGDATDNIPGLYNVGAKSTWVKQVKELNTEEEMYYYVLDKYQSYFGSYAYQFVVENARLLNMMHRPYVWWSAPDKRSGLDYWIEDGVLQERVGSL